jgi:hypothetical protein
MSNVNVIWMNSDVGHVGFPSSKYYVSKIYMSVSIISQLMQYSITTVECNYFGYYVV